MSNLAKRCVQSFLLKQLADHDHLLSQAMAAHKLCEDLGTAGMVAYAYHARKAIVGMLAQTGWYFSDQERVEYGVE